MNNLKEYLAKKGVWEGITQGSYDVSNLTRDQANSIFDMIGKDLYPDTDVNNEQSESSYVLISGAVKALVKLGFEYNPRY